MELLAALGLKKNSQEMPRAKRIFTWTLVLAMMAPQLKGVFELSRLSNFNISIKLKKELHNVIAQQ